MIYISDVEDTMVCHTEEWIKVFQG